MDKTKPRTAPRLDAGVLDAWRQQHGPEAQRVRAVVAAATEAVRAAGTAVQTSGRGQRMYAGAEFTRTTADWFAPGTSADSELTTGLRYLRNRSRQLCRDNEYAKNAKRVVWVNVVGRGVHLQAQVKKRRGDGMDDKVNEAIEQQWHQWGKARRCHTAGKLSWDRLTQMAVMGAFESGEILVRLVRRTFGDSTVPLGIELVEADQLVDTWTGTNPSTGREIRMGVEVDEWQRPVGYWLYPRHPGDYLTSATHDPRNYIWLPAAEVIHVALFERPYQTRGVPWMHATLRKLRNMGGYEDAEIVAARASASIMGIRQKPEVDIPGDGADDSDEVFDDHRTMKLAPGEILDLEPGETFVGFNPSRPNSAMDPFMRYMLRSVAAGIGCSYESLSRDYSQSNYSSSRLALLEDRDLWRVLQDWLIETLCEPVFEAWLEMAVLSGALQLPAYETAPHIYQAMSWKPRGWKWIDPMKEGQAAKNDIRAGLTTLTDVLAEQGEDLEETLRKRRDEIALSRKYGLVLDTDPGLVTDKGQAQAGPSAGDAAGAPGDGATGAEPDGDEPAGQAQGDGDGAASGGAND